MSVNYEQITHQAFLPGVFIAFLGWVFANMNIVESFHVDGLNKYAFNIAIPVLFYNIIFKFSSSSLSFLPLIVSFLQVSA
jgi:predicted permease